MKAATAPRTRSPFRRHHSRRRRHRVPHTCAVARRHRHHHQCPRCTHKPILHPHTPTLHTHAPRAVPTPSGGCVIGSRGRGQVALLDELGLWADAAPVSAALVRAAPDDWDAYRTLLRCTARASLPLDDVRSLIGEMESEHGAARGVLWARVLLEQ
eukprot:1634482-Prymnesium_polylepis.1